MGSTSLSFLSSTTDSVASDRASDAWAALVTFFLSHASQSGALHGVLVSSFRR